MQQKTVFLDLDGTMTDSGQGIINSFNYALGKMAMAIWAMIQIGLLARRFGKALRALGCHRISWTSLCRITAIAIAVARC